MFMAKLTASANRTLKGPTSSGRFVHGVQCDEQNATTGLFLPWLTMDFRYKRKGGVFAGAGFLAWEK